jgi:hypothetical protein
MIDNNSTCLLSNTALFSKPWYQDFENKAVFDSKQVELLYVRQHSGMDNTNLQW